MQFSSSKIGMQVRKNKSQKLKKKLHNYTDDNQKINHYLFHQKGKEKL
jgi:hypothetical protein